jgi:Tfp pilus assembly protein PilW
MPNCLFKNEQASKGTSLVELLVVVAIMGVVIMAVMSLFIPSVQNTAVQTELADVQGNLRLATDRITDDLLTAGFLIGSGLPIIFEASATPTNADNPDSTDFTIRTRAVGNSFARVTSATSTVVTLAREDMVDKFPVDSLVRLFDPVNAREIDETATPSAADRVYTVTDVNKAAKTLTIDSGGVLTDIEDETVVVRVKEDTAPTIQTIRYRLIDSDGDGANDTLTRTVNGADTQFLARGLSAVNFVYDRDSDNRVRKVEVTLTGKTTKISDNAIADEKTREIKTSVTLRNVF